MLPCAVASVLMLQPQRCGGPTESSRATEPSEFEYLIAIAKDNQTKIRELLNEETDGERQLKIHQTIQTTPLHLACEFQMMEALRSFLNSQANVNILQFNGCSPLYIASQKGHHQVVQLLIEAQAEVNFQQRLGASPLYVASQDGHDKVVKLLIRAEADVNLQINTGESPLHCASRKGHRHVVELLTAANANVNHQMSDGFTPLYSASENGHGGVVESLIKAFADVNLQNNEKCTPLFVAAQNGFVKIVRALIRAQADVDLQEVDGCSPLYMAAQNGHDGVVKLLIEAKAHVNLVRATGSSPLYVASQNNYESIVNQLIQAGADVNAQRKTGESAVYSAAQNGHYAIVKLLIGARADVNIQRQSGQSPLCAASQLGHDRVVNLLLKAGADPDCQDDRGCTALLIAAQNGHERVVASLIQAQTDVNIHANDGLSPLFIAAQNRHTHIVSLLIAAQANVDVQESQGGTPLYIASQLGHDQIVSLLIKAGADVNLQESDGCSPLFIAAQNGRERIVHCLVRAHADASCLNSEGVSPLQTALLNGHSGVAEFLRGLNPGEASDAAADISPASASSPTSASPASQPNISESDLSQQLHSALSQAGFGRSRAALQSALGDVLEQILGDRHGTSQAFFIVGSYSEGWGNSLTQLDGRTDVESDIDMMRLIRGRLYHLGDHCKCNEVKPADLAHYSNGHVFVTGFASNPAVPSHGSSLRPAVDQVYACRLCCYPPIGPLQSERVSSIPHVVLQSLRQEVATSPCHVVHAAAPGQAGKQLRVSTTFLERRLLRSLTSLQGQLFVTLKYLVKKVIGRRMNGLKAYHAKTVTFRMLEETPPDHWRPENLVCLTRRALQILLESCISESADGRVMNHFFLVDAALYLKGSDRSGAQEVIQVLNGVMEELPELLMQFRNSLRPISSSGRFYFHPFAILPILSPSPVPRAGELNYHEIFDVVRESLLKLSQPDDSKEFAESLTELIATLPDCARTARETLRALACLKFGFRDSALKVLMYSRMHEVSRGIDWFAGRSATEATVEFVWSQLKSCDSAWKFCFEFEQPLILPFLPASLADWSLLRLRGTSSYFFINFEAVLHCLRLELTPGDSSAGDWVDDVLMREDADEQELVLSVFYCTDVKQLARVAIKLDAISPISSEMRELLKVRMNQLKK